MAVADLIALAACVEQLHAVFADGFEHEQPALPDRLEQVPVDEAGDLIEVRSCSPLGGVQREGSAEGGQAQEDALEARVEQVVAPLDRRTQRLLTLGRIARAAGEQRETSLEPFEQERRVENLHPRGRERERKRQPIEASADLLHGVVEADIAVHLPCPLDEELDGLRLRKRIQRELALAGQTKANTTRCQELQLRRTRKQLADFIGSRQKMLEVVEKQQSLGVS